MVTANTSSPPHLRKVEECKKKRNRELGEVVVHDFPRSSKSFKDILFIHLEIKANKK